MLDFEKPLVELENRVAQLRASAGSDPSAQQALAGLEREAAEMRRKIYAELSTWQKVQLSRHPERPYFLDYVNRLFTDFVELHGDRSFADDPSIVAGFASFDGQSVAIVGHQKGRSTKEKLKRNFGMPHPEGYRKAVRIMELAARFGRPVLTFIDTPGAYPGIGAEERGQSQAIGASILAMSQLGVPVVATVIGEGGSGGALALGVANRVLMQQFATYSVITPEGCASILWRDGARAPDAAEQLKLLADDAVRMHIVDEVVAEPEGGAHRDVDGAADLLAQALRTQLRALRKESSETLRNQRYNRFRRLGQYREPSGTSAAPSAAGSSDDADGKSSDSGAFGMAANA